MRSILILCAAVGLAGCTPETDETDPVDDTLDGPFECEGDVCTLSGTITEDVTLTADKMWLIRGGVYIGDDDAQTVLTIEPGTTLYGESSTDGMLVITRGSKIVADGTSDAPIVMTSSKAPGDRARGDWGGLIINGRAPINSCAEGTADCEAYGEGGTGWYGGRDVSDDSGVLRYVRVEFAGTLVSPDNELNGIAFQGVGSGTTVDYIQVHMNADDGVEFFGGTVSVRHVLVTGVGDDLMDWTDGWQGNGQFIVLQQYEDAGDNGIEADNNGEANDASPRSMPTLSHVTVLGQPESSNSDFGVLLREGTGASIHNAVVTGWNEACLNVDHDATVAQIGTGLDITHSVLDCTTALVSETGLTETTAMWDAGESNVIGNPWKDDPYSVGNTDYRPASDGPAASGAMTPADSWFEDVAWRGGVDPTMDWTAGWTLHDRN